MKKLFVFVSLIGMVIGLFSCGNNANENQTTENYDVAVVGYDTVVFVGTVTTPDGRCLQAEDTVVRTVLSNTEWKSVEEPKESLSEENQESMDRYFTTIEFPETETERNWKTHYEDEVYVHTFTREGVSYGCLEALMEKIQDSQVKKSWEDCNIILDSILLVRLYGELPKRVNEKKLELLTEWVSVETLPTFKEIIEKMNSAEAWPQKGFFPPEWGKPVAVRQMLESEPVKMTTLLKDVKAKTLAI